MVLGEPPPPAVDGGWVAPGVEPPAGGVVPGDVPGVTGPEVPGGDVAGGVVTGGRVVGGVLTGGRVVGGVVTGGRVVGGVVTGGRVVGGVWGRVVGGEVGMVLTGMLGGGVNAGMCAAECTAGAEVWAGEPPLPGWTKNNAEPPTTTCPTTRLRCRRGQNPCRDIETTEDDIGGLPAFLEHLPARLLSIPPFAARTVAWPQPERS